MNKTEDNLNNKVDGDFISEEKSQSIFGTNMARASVVQSLFESEISKDYKAENINNLHFYQKLNKSKQKIANTILKYALENKNETNEKQDKQKDQIEDEKENSKEQDSRKNRKKRRRK